MHWWGQGAGQGFIGRGAEHPPPPPPGRPAYAQPTVPPDAKCQPRRHL